MDVASVYVGILTPIASIISYGLLYYFVFEMMYIVATIKSMSHTDRIERNERIKKTKIILLTLYFVVYAPCTLIGHFMYNSNPI